jgi:Predicted dehydrogenase
LESFDIAIIGGGIVGLATAKALIEQRPHLRLVLLEAEDRLATHQTGHNSGVIHSGLYYKPGSLKAKLCAEGRDDMYRFCQEYGIPHEACGKIVVATSQDELPRLQDLYNRGTANGLDGLRWLTPEEIREFEPHSSGIRGLFVKQTGIVDYKSVARKFGEILLNQGCSIKTGARVMGCRRQNGSIVLSTQTGDVLCKAIVNCGGLQCDRVARICGTDPEVKIIPFRGEYYELAPAKRSLVRNLIYPVPDPQFPFLGVHFTRRIDGAIEAGPNAVLAFKREGYKKTDFSPADVAETLRFPGFWRMASKYYATGMGEMWRSLRKEAFVTALRRLVPELTAADVRPAGSGVRAQAVDATGRLLDDFHVVHGPQMIHILNAPSPAATASLAIGRAIAQMANEL